MTNATYAYFPGTGPAGATCNRCKSIKPKARMTGKFWCEKAAQFIGSNGETKPIQPASRACKYFEPK